MTRTRLLLAMMVVLTLVIVSTVLLAGFWNRNQLQSTARTGCKLRHVASAQCARAYPRSPLIP